MDYIELLKVAELKLEATNKDVIEIIKLKIRSGSTGGEIFDSLAEYLQQMKNEKHPAYLLMSHEIDLFLKELD